MLYPVSSLAKKKEKDIWQTHETLTNRLSTEWYRIGVLRNDLENIRDILNDLRDFELFPEKVTKLNEDKIVSFDRSIEKTEKKLQGLIDELNRIRLPLSDAIAILREMVISKPVEDMFEVIEQGDLERLAQLLALKHEMDILWQETDQIMNRINTDMGFEPFAEDTTFTIEKEFFDIIKANLGQQADDYYHTLNTMRNALIKRAGDFEIKRMFKVELHQLKQSIVPDKELIIKRKILLMKERYANKVKLHELNLLLSGIYFRLGEYRSAFETIDLLPDDPAFTSEKVLYTVQSWYALEEFEKIWEWGKTFDFTLLIGTNKNLVLWLLMESALALNISADLSQFAQLMNNGFSYHLHVMHALARSYILTDEPQIALSIFKKALENEPVLEVDKEAYNRILLAYAQTLFENENYRTALDQFFTLLNNGTYFEEALFGIAWCYLNLNMYQNAETTLRKLINQSPQSSRAAEAISVMTKRFVNKAQYEWRKTTYLDREEKRLERAIAQISDKLSTLKDREKIKKYKTASNEIADLLKQLKEEKREDYTGIRAYYDHAMTICNLIAKHYETGSFQEITFSERREKILHQLDSLIAAGKNKAKDHVRLESVSTLEHRKIKMVKRLVDKSFVLSADIKLSLYKWEMEYINRQKISLSNEERQINSARAEEKDSSKLILLVEQKKDITAQIDTLIQKENRLTAQSYKTLTGILAQLVETPLDTADEIYLRYHLGELYYQEENRKFSHLYDLFEQEIMQYDSLMALFHEGKHLEMPLEPEAPALNHNNSMKQFQTVLAKYPDNTFIAAPIYSLAWCYNDLGMFDSAVAHMALVANDYKNSPYAAQAWMYLGEYLFENAKLDSAIVAYRSVMKHPESEWFDDALYKLAWTQYRLSNPEKAISSFLALVDLGKEEKAGKALLETESLDYIAISFSETDLTGDKGLKRAVAFCKKLGDPEKGTQILHRLAGVYEEQGRYETAKKSYQKLLNMYPRYQKNPEVESNLIAVTTRDQSLEEANIYKINFFKKYHRESAWAKKQEDSATIAQADSIAAGQLYDASITYHQLALQNNDSTAYNQATKTYRDYIHYYPTSPQSNECHYNLAEILFSIGKYYEAAEEYMAVSKRYPDSKYKETAAWNAIVASQNLLKQEGKKE